MEQLLEMAERVCEQAEIFTLSYTGNVVSFENAKAHAIDTGIQSGLSLRVIKDGKLGFAYTRNLRDPGRLLQNALESLKGGVEVGYSFPFTETVAHFADDPSVSSLNNTALVEEADRVCTQLVTATSGEIMARTYGRWGTLRLMNSAGTDLSSRFSKTGVYAEIIYPGTGTGIGRMHTGKRFSHMPAALMEQMIFLYSQSARVVAAPSGKTKVLFMPGSMHTLTWRIQSALNAKNVYEKISPAADKLGRRLFDPKFTLLNDPLHKDDPDARTFDDEGVPGHTFFLIENGILQNFYYDLNYARKFNVTSTGHGFKSQQWGGDVFSFVPNPTLAHLRIRPGEASLAELIQSMDKGLIVEGALGAHSGNIPNGDFSIGAEPALYVEKGEIVGRAKDVMVSGNIYETLNRIIALEDTQHRVGDGWVPAVLCDQVSVSTKRIS
jgi:PmbA protein